MDKATEIFKKHWVKATGKPLDETTKHHMNYAIEAINEAFLLSAVSVSNLKQYLVTYRKVINSPHALLDDEVVTMSKIVEVLNPVEINDLVKNIVDIKRIF